MRTGVHAVKLCLVAILSVMALSAVSGPTVHAGQADSQVDLFGLADQVCGPGTGAQEECRAFFIQAVTQCYDSEGMASNQRIVDCVIDTVPPPYDEHLEQSRTEILHGLAPAVDNSTGPTQPQSRCYGSVLGFPAWYEGLQCDEFGPQITKLNDVWIIVLNMIRWMLGIAAYAAALFIIWGGFKYIKSQGDPSAIANAKTTIFQAVGGLVIALVANLVVAYVVGIF